MKVRDRRLLHEIVIVVVVKLVLLTLLWHAFVREQRVEVDAAAFAQRLNPPSATSPSAPPDRESSHDQ